MMIRSFRWTMLVAAAACPTACQQDGPGAQARLELGHAWARATAPGQDAGGGFLTIRGGGSADRLVGGSTPVARSVEFHAMEMDGKVMRMRRQAAVAVPAGASVKLAPGGLHLMLVGLEAPLRQGTAFPLTLEFEKAGPKQVEVKVLAITSTGPREAGDE